MATEPLEAWEESGKTVAYRCIQPVTGKVFDFDDGAWKANLPACTTPNLSAAENTDIGDATHSLYVAELNLGALNDTQTAMRVFVQAIEVADPVVVLNIAGMWVWGGQWILWDLDGDPMVFGGM